MKTPALAFVTGAAAALLSQGMVMCAEVRVIAATPMAAVIEELGQPFERETGHKLVTRFVSGPVVKRQIDAGETFDAAISITPVIDALVKEGKIVPATRTDVAYAGVGVGVRAGVPKPDIGSVDAFRRALLGAKSVAHSAEGASGTYFKNLLERLGIAEEMKPRLRPMSADRIGQALPRGEAEMIVVTNSVIVSNGVALVGPVPAELQFYNTFAAGVMDGASEPEAARALIRFLTMPSVIPVIKSKGMEPGVP